VSGLHGIQVDMPTDVIRRIEATCPIAVDVVSRRAAGLDWWPLGLVWATEDAPTPMPAVVARPQNRDHVAAVLRVCNDDRIPVTTIAGRSGVCGASVPVHGGVALDVTALAGIVAVDDSALVVDVGAGTGGTALEDALRHHHGLTLGHWPQSIDISTVGGWLACRSAGQFSTRYGKIEDMVVGLDVVLADGRAIRTGGAPRAAVGPDLNQVFVGSEGTLGVITRARLRVHPAPTSDARAAYEFADFTTGLHACRRIVRRGATPAVLRLYDGTEAQRNFDRGAGALLLVLDEGDDTIVSATMEVVAAECKPADAAPNSLVDQWLEQRSDVSALRRYIDDGFVVDTMEVAALWSSLPQVYQAVCGALEGTAHMLAASAHCSHAYADGACLYFTFGGKPPMDERDSFYRSAWDAATVAALNAGATLSHHHGVGLNRARFTREALGGGFDVLVALKGALDPHGILNPGKLGLPDPWGPPAWP
jgi:alkyldihydroxyacetonephosphate synthase